MDKITEIKQYIKEKTNQSEEIVESKKTTNPIKKTDKTCLKDLAKFVNQDVSKKFDINDLLR